MGGFDSLTIYDQIQLTKKQQKAAVLLSLKDPAGAARATRANGVRRPPRAAWSTDGPRKRGRRPHCTSSKRRPERAARRGPRARLRGPPRSETSPRRRQSERRAPAPEQQRAGWPPATFALWRGRVALDGDVGARAGRRRDAGASPRACSAANPPAPPPRGRRGGVEGVGDDRDLGARRDSGRGIRKAHAARRPVPCHPISCATAAPRRRAAARRALCQYRRGRAGGGARGRSTSYSPSRSADASCTSGRPTRLFSTDTPKGVTVSVTHRT